MKTQVRALPLLLKCDSGVYMPTYAAGIREHTRAYWSANGKEDKMHADVRKQTYADVC